MCKTQIQKLVKSQPKGFVQTIADRLEVSRKTVYDAIDREKMDHKVIEEMIKLAEEYKIKLVELGERINRVAS